MKHQRSVIAASAALLFTLTAHAWDYERHQLINDLALTTLSKDFPAFVRLPANRERILFLSGEPDRWRNNRDRALRHLNNLDHYFDFEYLDPYQLKPADLSHFRYRYVEQMANARAHLKLELPEANPDHTKGHPGFLPWAINENYLKLVSAFSYLKVFEKMGTEEEKNNAILVCHALTGDQYVSGHNPITGKDGWWSRMVGPNKPIDTNKLYVVCLNNLGGCHGSTGPTSKDPSTKKIYGSSFPIVTVSDWVRSQKELMKYLDIPSWRFIVGGSFLFR